ARVGLGGSRTRCNIRGVRTRRRTNSPRAEFSRMPTLADPHDQAATEVSSPQLREAIIRDVWPSVAAHPGPAGLARGCYRTIILAPVGWLVLAPIYFMKLLAVLPGLSGLATRYRLTNRRLMLCKGLRPVPA